MKTIYDYTYPRSNVTRSRRVALVVVQLRIVVVISGTIDVNTDYRGYYEYVEDVKE